MASKKESTKSLGFIGYIVIIVIAVLITITAHVGFNAFYTAPEYPNSDCYDKARVAPAESLAYQINETEYDNCQAEWQASYDTYDTQQETRNRWKFGILTVLFLVSLFVGLYAPFAKQNVDAMNNKIIANALVLAGLIGLFYTTGDTWQALNTQLQFVIILIETIVVIWIVYKKMK